MCWPRRKNRRRLWAFAQQAYTAPPFKQPAGNASQLKAEEQRDVPSYESYAAKTKDWTKAAGELPQRPEWEQSYIVAFFSMPEGRALAAKWSFLRSPPRWRVWRTCVTEVGRKRYEIGVPVFSLPPAHGLFCGGAEGRQQDAEMRVPSIRGHLRDWHRQLVGVPRADIVWGSTDDNTGHSSKIAVTVDKPDNTVASCRARLFPQVEFTAADERRLSRLRRADPGRNELAQKLKNRKTLPLRCLRTPHSF